MEEVSSIERAGRIVALIAQSNKSRRETELQPLLPLFELLSNKLGAILRTYTPELIKCSVSGFGTEQVNAADYSPHGAGFQSGKLQFNACFPSDRAFDSLLCEVCFGGSAGQTGAAEENQRPPSRIESLLRRMVLDTFYDGFPEMLKEVAKITFDPKQIEEAHQKSHDKSPLSCVRVTILVNVSSNSAELDVLMPVRDIESILGESEAKPNSGSRDMRSVIGDCPFEVIIALQPQDIGLNEVLNLSVGSMLRLGCTHADLTHLEIEGFPVGKGQLNISADQFSVTVI